MHQINTGIKIAFSHREVTGMQNTKVIMQNNDFIEELLRLAGLGALGGLARYLQLTYLQTKIFEWGAFFATMLVGSVCGIAIGWVVGAFKQDWQNVSAIVSGVIGLQLVYVLASIVSKITGKQFGIEIREIDMQADIDARIATKRYNQEKVVKERIVEDIELTAQSKMTNEIEVAPKDGE